MRISSSNDNNTEKIKQERAVFFQNELLLWAAKSHRPLPWKGERNPYLIWLSEIILQQTKVEQGLPYYLKFSTQYPTVKDLADAPTDEVMKLWEGLGYYSRARNLHETAQYIAYELEGVFPVTYDKILRLKGIGAYTAAAIASFAYDLPHAVVDGNVYRVLARFFGIDTPIDSVEGQKQFQTLAQSLLIPNVAAHYNQAIMDFGATHCTPKTPLCSKCDLLTKCEAAQQKRVDFFPVKSKKIKKKERFFNYFIVHWNGGFWIQRREAKDIWQQLYEFPLIESDTLWQVDKNIENEYFTNFFNFKLNNKNIIKISKIYKQQLTHQTILGQFFEIKLLEKPMSLPESWVYVKEQKIKNFAFPKLIDMYFQDKYLSLSLF